MDQEQQRDHAEEEYNRREMEREGREELEAEQHEERLAADLQGIDDVHPYQRCPFCRHVFNRYMQRSKAELVALIKPTIAYSEHPPERWRKEEVAWSLVEREVRP